jgi:UrcA family protein
MPRSSLANCLALSAAAVVFAATAACAQEYTYSYHAPDPPRYAPAPRYAPQYAQGSDEVIVIAPHRYNNERSDIGAPIGDVGISRQVRFDDLDLSTPWGAQRLRERVRYTAHALCRRLDAQYPVNAPGEPSDRFGSTDCYRDAVADGMSQADQAIAQYRD